MIWPFKPKGPPKPVEAAAPGPVALDALDLFSAPSEVYARLRGSGPVHPVASGGYLLLTYRDVSEALRNPGLGNAPSRFSAIHGRFRDTRVAADLANSILPFLDPPEHGATRKLLIQAYGQRLRQILPELDSIAVATVTAAGPGTVDMISTISSPFAIRVMTRFFGLPDEAGPRIKPYTESFFRLFAPLSDPEILAQVNSDLAAFRQVLVEHIEEGHIEEGGFLAAQPEGMTREAMIDNAILLFADGVENIERGMASILLRLFREDRLQDFDTDPTALIAEALRLDSPAQIIARVAKEATEIAGQPIAAGSPVFLCLGAANRDPERFDDPDRFDPTRETSALTFGSGRHSCIGAMLADGQFCALLAALRQQNVSVSEQEVPYLSRVGHLWPERLEVSLGGAAGAR